MKRKPKNNFRKKNNLSVCENSKRETAPKLTSRGPKERNLRLELHKAGRSVTLKHLSILCSRSTQEVKKLIQVFCMTLNVFKLKERRIKMATIHNWASVCKYISKHNNSITSEVVSAANKIEKGCYDKDLMEDVIREFDNVEIKDRSDSSSKIVHRFIKL